MTVSDGYQREVSCLESEIGIVNIRFGQSWL